MADFIFRRPLAPRETDYEALLLGVTLVTAALGWLWLHYQLPTPLCPFAHFLGLPCPTCGGTRAVKALVAGDFWAALQFNPMIVTCLSVLAAVDGYAAFAVIFRSPRIRFGPFPKKFSNVFRMLIWTGIVLNWTYLVFTLPIGRH